MLDVNSGRMPLIGFVGVCASGKTTLVRRLEARGYRCRHIAQEHSYVPTMWLQLTHPDHLIYLAVDYSTTLQRKHLDWTLEEYEEQLRRLRHAHDHADLIVDTSAQSLDETLELIVNQLTLWGVTPQPSRG
jgi:molybdopterin-guanine dinucleotide biosynthesis protein